jgi:hypothetical protein
MTTYSQSELVRESQRLGGTTHGGFMWIRVVGPSPDLTHLQVEVHPGGLAEAAARNLNPNDVIESRYPVIVTGEADPRPA